MKGKIFVFDAQEISYIQAIKKTGRVNTAQGEKIQQIVRRRVNPMFNMCTSCGGEVAAEFSRVVGWIEDFIGCNIKEFDPENCEELMEESKERVLENELKLEEEKENKIKEREKAKDDFKKKKEKEQKQKEANKKRRTTNRIKKQKKLKKEREQRKADRNKELEDKRKAKAEEVSKWNEIAKEALKVLILSNSGLHQEEEGIKSIGTAQEIIDEIKKTTGITINIDPKSKQLIVNEALSISRKIFEFGNNNPDLVAEIKKLKEETTPKE